MDLPILLTNVCYLTQNHFSGVNPPDGFGDPRTKGAQAPHTIAGAFFVPAVRVMAAVRGRPKGLPVPFGRFANLRTAVSLVWRQGDGSSLTKGTITMHTLSLRLHALNPSRIQRAKAHRAMALAALRSDSSLKNRLSRYNYHTEKARQLEIAGGVQ